MIAIQTNRDDEFRDEKRAQMLDQVSKDAPGKKSLFERVYRGKTSPRQAIKAKCLECCWMDEAAIRECTAPACPLWGLRPYQRRSRKAVSND
ncbi:MAG: hypothetical protein KJ626_10075 [Verrucomicrobia bacterium]|nr:hypothetical protein [Verrucomicrobiota bacterium]